MAPSIISACDLSRAIDSLANDLSNLMGGAFVMLRQCEVKLRDLKLLGQVQRAGAREMLESEIASLLAATAELYSQASAKACTTRSTFNALVAQALPGDCGDADAAAVLSACRQTGESLEAFEKLIAEFGRQMATDLEVFRKASSVPDMTSRATGTFEKLMAKVMGKQRDRTA